MGWQAAKTVWATSELTGSAKLLMLAIAEHADRRGRAWPSIARLAEMLNVSDRSIKRLIVECEEAGELRVERSVGRGNVNEYIILAVEKGDAHDTISEEEKVTNLVKKVSSVTKKGVIRDTQNDHESSRITNSGETPPPKTASKKAEHPAIQAWVTANRRNPGRRNYDFVIQRLGDNPRVDVLAYVCQLWDASGYNPTNLKGKTEWYQLALSAPDPLAWEPPHLPTKQANDKHERLDRLLNAVKRHGRLGGLQAKQELNGTWPIVEQMGGWHHVASMPVETIRIRFYQALKETA